jgi:hypothetical protein
VAVARAGRRRAVGTVTACSALLARAGAARAHHLIVSERHEVSVVAGRANPSTPAPRVARLLAVGVGEDIGHRRVRRGHRLGPVLDHETLREPQRRDSRAPAGPWWQRGLTPRRRAAPRLHRTS